MEFHPPISSFDGNWKYPALGILHYYGSGIVAPDPDPALPNVADPDSILKTADP